MTTLFVYINLTTRTAHAYPALDAPPPKLIIKIRAGQVIAFVFFRTGPEFNITANQADEVFTAANHGLVNGNRVIFPELVNGNGLKAGTFPYYIIDKTTDTFKVSKSQGGAAVNFTSNVTSGTCRLSTAGDEIAGWVAGKVVVKHKTETAALLLDSSITAEGSGEAAMYKAGWSKATCNSDAAIVFLAGLVLPRDCFCEFEWEDGDGTYSVAFPIKLGPTFNSDEDGAPPIEDPETESWINERAVLHDRVQTLSDPQIVQALGNLGITLGSDGKLTFHTGHSIYLDAPPP